MHLHKWFFSLQTLFIAQVVVAQAYPQQPSLAANAVIDGDDNIDLNITVSIFSKGWLGYVKCTCRSQRIEDHKAFPQ